MPQAPILFVSHEASQSGAPFLLLHLLRWLRANTKLDFQVALNSTGKLQPQFAELAPTTVFRREAVLSPLSRLVPYRAKTALNVAKFRRALSADRFSLIYSNTLVNANLLRSLPDQQCPVISHVHELDYVLKQWTTPSDLEYMLGRTAKFVACSQSVADNLSRNLGVGRDRLEVVHEFIPSTIVDDERLAHSAREVRSELGIPADAIVVGGTGSVTWRKGYDLFILVALCALRHQVGRPIHFVWLGGTSERNIPFQIAHDVKTLGLEQCVHFIDHRSNPLDYMAMYDMFCLTSREDPYPLVMLEAAALGKPVICFDKAGGGPEFVGTDSGFVVPYLDVQTMADRIVQLARDTAMRETLGVRGRQKVRERHDVAIAAPRIAQIIERSIYDANAGR